MKPGRFLGIAWQHGDLLWYLIRTELEDGKRPQTLVRSIVRSAKELKLPANSLNNEVNLNLNLCLDPAPDPNDIDQCKGIGELDKDHLADDTTVHTAST